MFLIIIFLGSTLYFCCCWVASVVLNSLQPMVCSLPGSSVHGILQTKILEWIAMPYSRGSSPPAPPAPTPQGWNPRLLWLLHCMKFFITSVTCEDPTWYWSWAKQDTSTLVCTIIGGSREWGQQEEILQIHTGTVVRLHAKELAEGGIVLGHEVRGGLRRTANGLEQIYCFLKEQKHHLS